MRASQVLQSQNPKYNLIYPIKLEEDSELVVYIVYLSTAFIGS